MADYGAFDRTLNANPSLSKRFIIGDGITEEENITLQQYKDLILPTDGVWAQLGLNASWENWSLDGMRSGVYYRINKIGQLEIDISVRHAAVAFNNILAQLPVGFRPTYSRVIRSADYHRGTKILATAGVVVGSGATISGWFVDQGITLTAEKLSTGLIRINHNIGNTDYLVYANTFGNASEVATPIYAGRVYNTNYYFDISFGDDSSKNDSNFIFEIKKLQPDGGIGNAKIVISTDGGITINPLNEYATPFVFAQSIVIPLT